MPNGEKYDGDWRAGQREGRGTQTLTDGTIRSGFWKADQFRNAALEAPEQKSAGASGFPEDHFGTVSVQCETPSADVAIDGRYVGNAPAKLKLRGPHTVTVQKAGYKEFSRELHVDDGAELTLHLELEKE